jgi:hypothetical protein
MNIFIGIFYLLQILYCKNRNYSKQKINMVNFIQANEDDMNMSAKIQY